MSTERIDNMMKKTGIAIIILGAAVIYLLLSYYVYRTRKPDSIEMGSYRVDLEIAEHASEVKSAKAEEPAPVERKEYIDEDWYFIPEKYQGDMGKISTGFRGDSEIITLIPGTECDGYKIYSEEGILEIPVGDYKITDYILFVALKDGKSWSADCYTLGSIPTITVSKGKITDLDIGSSLTISADPTLEKDGVINIDLLIEDSSGNKYGVRPDHDTRNKFEVLDKNGKVVWADDFEFLCCCAYGYYGEVPKGLKGDYVIRLVMEESPQGVKVRETEWKR